MNNGASRGALRFFAIGCLASLILPWPASESARAETAGFDCGRETDEVFTEPRSVWFAIYHRRLSLALALGRNGNVDLADRFEQCALAALRKAAEMGHTEAQYLLGIHLAQLKPQSADRQAEAYRWLEKAAAGGYARAKVFVEGWPKSWAR